MDDVPVFRLPVFMPLPPPPPPLYDDFIVPVDCRPVIVNVWL
jgi:hypothetical protein